MTTAPTPLSPRKRALFEDEHHDYRESYARFLQKEVVPHLEDWERAQIVPRELFTKCAEHGFLAMEVPEQYGGSGVSDWRFNVVLAGFVMAELKTKIEITRCVVDRCIERYIDGTCTVEEAAMAKWWTTDLLGDVTDAGVQLHGGYGYTIEYPIGKAWVDARISRIYAGTNEIMKELIGRTLGL